MTTVEGVVVVPRAARWLLVCLVLLVVALAVVDAVGSNLEERGRAMASDGRWEIAKGVLTLDGARVRAGGEQVVAGERLVGVGRRLDVVPGWWTA